MRRLPAQPNRPNPSAVSETFLGDLKGAIHSLTLRRLKERTGKEENSVLEPREPQLAPSPAQVFFQKLIKNPRELEDFCKNLAKEGKAEIPLTTEDSVTGENIIFVLMRHPDLYKYIPLLSKKGADVNHRNADNKSPLISAVIDKRTEALGMVLEGKPNASSMTVTLGNELFNVPCNIIDLALESENKTIYQLLTTYLSRAHISLTPGGLFLLYAYMGELTKLRRMMVVANLWGIKLDVNWRHPSRQATPIILAAGNGREGGEAVVRFLIEKKADLNIQEYQGYYPLETAISSRNPVLFKLVLEAGDPALINQVHPLNDFNQSPLTIAPLTIAISQHLPRMVEILLDKKADVNVVVDNLTPLERAIMLQDLQMVELLAHTPGVIIMTAHLILAMEQESADYLRLLVCSPMCSNSFLREISDPSLGLFTILYKKEPHFKMLVTENKINLNAFEGLRPFLNYLLEERRSDWLKWVTKHHSEKLELSTVQYCLMYAINNNQKDEAALFIERFSHRFSRYSRIQFALYCLQLKSRKKNWVKEALKLAPELRVFLNIQVVLKLFEEALSPEEIRLNFTPIILQLINSFSGRDKKGREKLENMFLSSRGALQETPVQNPPAPIEPKPNWGLSPYAYLKGQGLDPEFFFSREDKRLMPIEGKSCAPPKVVCSWFDGRIFSSDAEVFPIDSRKGGPTKSFLFVPPTIWNDPQAAILLGRSRWTMSSENGIVNLNPPPPGTFIFRFQTAIFTAKTGFNFEIKHSATRARILGTKVQADENEKKDKPSQKSVLYVAAFWSRKGLHDSIKKLPQQVTLDMENINSQGSNLEL